MPCARQQLNLGKLPLVYSLHNLPVVEASPLLQIRTLRLGEGGGSAPRRCRRGKAARGRSPELSPPSAGVWVPDQQERHGLNLRQLGSWPPPTPSGSESEFSQDLQAIPTHVPQQHTLLSTATGSVRTYKKRIKMSTVMVIPQLILIFLFTLFCTLQIASMSIYFICNKKNIGVFHLHLSIKENIYLSRPKLQKHKLEQLFPVRNHQTPDLGSAAMDFNVNREGNVYIWGQCHPAGCHQPQRSGEEWSQLCQGRLAVRRGP